MQGKNMKFNNNNTINTLKIIMKATINFMLIKLPKNFKLLLILK